MLLQAPFRAVGPREPERVMNEIVIDSLAPFLLGCLEGCNRIVDFGCGAGIPSLPLAVVTPGVTFVGVDSVIKKVEFARLMGRALQLDNAMYLRGRFSMEQGRPYMDERISDREVRAEVGRADSLLMRAVGPIHESLPLGSVFLRKGGTVIFYSTEEAGRPIVDAGGLPGFTIAGVYNYMRQNSDRPYLLLKLLKA